MSNFFTDLPLFCFFMRYQVDPHPWPLRSWNSELKLNGPFRIHPWKYKVGQPVFLYRLATFSVFFCFFMRYQVDPLPCPLRSWNTNLVNTNNYIKSSFCVLKDNTLGRTKVNIFHGCTKGWINLLIDIHLLKKKSLIS